MKCKHTFQCGEFIENRLLVANKVDFEFLLVAAVKQISKQYTNDTTFQREMDAFMHMRKWGGHPNICGLRENFDEGDFYYLILDLIQGGEMFDHLIKDGAYSEADAARLVREVGSALSFLHGIGLVHSDLKPENLYVNTETVTVNNVQML
jgi:serine/threonine protein kinase